MNPAVPQGIAGFFFAWARNGGSALDESLRSPEVVDGVNLVEEINRIADTLKQGTTSSPVYGGGLRWGNEAASNDKVVSEAKTLSDRGGKTPMVFFEKNRWVSNSEDSML